MQLPDEVKSRYIYELSHGFIKRLCKHCKIKTSERLRFINVVSYYIGNAEFQSLQWKNEALPMHHDCAIRLVRERNKEIKRINAEEVADLFVLVNTANHPEI